MISFGHGQEECGGCSIGRCQSKEAVAKETQRYSPRSSKSAVEERESKMKTLFAILLTAGTAFTQAPRRDSLQPAPPTVTYEWVTPDCTGIDGAFNQISSGCAFTKLKVTAHSFNPGVDGFYILVSFHDMIDQQRVTTTFTQERDGSFTALFFVGDPSTSTVLEVRARELVEGQVAVAH